MMVPLGPPPDPCDEEIEREITTTIEAWQEIGITPQEAAPALGLFPAFMYHDWDMLRPHMRRRHREMNLIS